MSMKKFTKKMLAIVAAGAMTMGLAMPAFAAGTDTMTKEAYITKVFNTEVEKDVDFTFSAVQQKNGGSVNNLVDTDAAVAIDKAEFKTTDGKGTITKRWAVTFPAYQEAGKYSYKVTETGNSLRLDDKGEKEKMLMSKAEYLMDVYVSNTATGGYEISNIVVSKTKNDKGEADSTIGKVDISNGNDNGFKFVNTYVQEAGTGIDPSNPGTDYDNLGSLNVSKKVEKNVTTGETTKPTTGDTFSFTAVFAFPAGTDENTLGGVDANGTKITLTNGTTHIFTLTDGANMKFTKLPVGTTITVTEDAKANYKGSAVVTLNGTQESTKAAQKYNEEITVSDKKLGQNKNIVDVTNRFNNVPTTGIIMNTLPYVLMVVLCAAALFGFVAFKRKKVQK